MLSDGKQAAKEIGVKIEDVGDKVQFVDEKVQVAIDRARSLPSQLLKLSNICIFRRRAGKSGGTRNNFGYSTGGQRRRRNEMFVIS